MTREIVTGGRGDSPGQSRARGAGVTATGGQDHTAETGREVLAG